MGIHINVGEVYVNLGIKGAEKTVGSLGEVKKGLGEVSHMSLEAKAGIIGMMYEMEHLTAASGKTGTGLTNFGALTGLSIKQLQQWQYAAMQAGVSSEEFTGSLKSVQQSMSNMLLGKGAPEGMGLVGIDPKRAKDTFYVMEKLQEFAKKAKPELGNTVLKGFGLSDTTIAAMRRGAFNPAVMKGAPTYSDKEVGQLDKANIAWSNLGHHIEMSIGKLNAAHGGQFVKDLSKMVEQIFKMIEAFAKLAEKLKLFSALGKVFGGIGTTADALASFGDSKKEKDKRLADYRVAKAKKEATEDTRPLYQKWGLFGSDKTAPVLNKPSLGLPPVPSPDKNPNMVSPNVPALGLGGKVQNIEVNQNLNFQHDGKDAAKTGDSTKKAIQDAYRQYSAQFQGS